MYLYILSKLCVQVYITFNVLSPSLSSNTHLRAGATTANTARESGKLISRLHSLVARRSAGYDVSAASLQIHSTSTGGVEISEKQGPVPVDK